MTGSFIKNYIRSWHHHPTMQSTTLVVLVGTFSVIAVFFCIQLNFTNILIHWGESVQMTVYLKDSSTETMTARLKDFLKSNEEFETVNYVDKAEAAIRFKKQMGSYSAGVLSDPDFGNPLPASFELKLKDRFRSSDVYHHLVELAQNITKMEGVDEVSYGQGWIENYGAFLKTFARASDLVIAILLLGSLFIVSHSIRSSIVHRRDEIEILELVGATARAIRAPYLFEGAMTGSVAAALALVLAYSFFIWQIQFFDHSLTLWGLTTTLSFLSAWQMLAFISLGGLAGWLAAFISVYRLASGWSASERAKG